MFCASCGHENPDDARFCGSCGQPVEARSRSDATSNRSAKAIPLVDRGSSGYDGVSNGLKYGVLIGSLLLPILGIGMGLYYWLSDGGEEKKALGRLWFFVGLSLAIVYGLASGNF